jgi:hypothetical protein
MIERLGISPTLVPKASSVGLSFGNTDAPYVAKANACICIILCFNMRAIS